MKLQTAARKRAKIKMGLQGPTGSGKTYTSLLISNGLCVSWDKVAVIDSENGSSELYSHLGPYQVLQLHAPFSPERYIEAITLCEKSGIEVVIIDSITHEWENLLEYHSSMQGNSFTNWGKVTPRHNAFVQKILQSPLHIICTMRTKQDYILNEKNGKMVPEKVGLKSVQRDGLDYEMTLVFDLDMKNNAVASKDRTGLFFGKPESKLSINTGREILHWCNQEFTGPTTDDVIERINHTATIGELVQLYTEFHGFQQVLKPEFEKRKLELLSNSNVTKKLASSKFPTNGVK
jgi:hypothetical protein